MSKQTATEDECRRGALAALLAMKAMVESAENPKRAGDDAASFFSWRRNDAAALAESLGPMPEFLRGAIMAMAEYVHFSITTGQPNLDLWRPVVAMTTDQLQDEIDQMQANFVRDSASHTSNVVPLHH